MTNWKFKKDIPEDVCLNTDEFWYDITDGGYINPRKILDDQEQVKRLLEAVALVKSFEDALSELSEEY